MTNYSITAIGIDVSKGKSMVAVRRPGGEVVILPFEVQYTVSGLDELIAKLKALDGDVRIVMEHTRITGSQSHSLYETPVSLSAS